MGQARDAAGLDDQRAVGADAVGEDDAAVGERETAA